MDLLSNRLAAKIKLLTVLVISAFVLSACSSTRTAYRYADWGVVWWVEDYVSLTDSQNQQLNNDLANLRQWHCSAELPRYQDWLDTLARDVQKGNLDPVTVGYHQERLFAFFQPLLDRVTPMATNLLASLSDAQVRELTANMAEKQLELEEEYLADSSRQTAEARAERIQERAERWLGELNNEQKAIVAAWSERRGRQTEIWLQGRRNWQLALLDSLEQRDEPGFSAQVERLIQQSEQARGPEYQAMMTESRAAIKTLMHDLMAASDTSHRSQLQAKATELNQDFAALTCAPGPEVADAG